MNEADEATSTQTGIEVVVASIPAPGGGVKAVRFRYRARFTINGKRLDTAITQFGLIRGGTAYVLTYTTLPKLAPGYRPTFDRSARSFQLG